MLLALRLWLTDIHRAVPRQARELFIFIPRGEIIPRVYRGKYLKGAK